MKTMFFSLIFASYCGVYRCGWIAEDRQREWQLVEAYDDIYIFAT